MSETFMYRLIGEAAQAGQSSAFVPPSILFSRKADGTDPIETVVNINSLGEWRIEFKEDGYFQFLNLDQRIEDAKWFACGGGGGGSTGIIAAKSATASTGGSGGGGGYCQEATANFTAKSLFRITIGTGGPGAEEPQKDGEDGKDTLVETKDDANNWAVLLRAEGGKGGKYPTVNSSWKATEKSVGGEGGSGGGAAGWRGGKGGIGGSRGSKGEDVTTNGGLYKGGQGSSKSGIPFGQSIGNAYGAGGAGSCGSTITSTAIGDVVIPGGLFGNISGGGSSGRVPSIIPNNLDQMKAAYNVKYSVVSTTATGVTLEGKTYYKKADITSAQFVEGYGDGGDGLPNSGGGGGGGVYRVKCKASKFPVAKVDKKGATTGALTTATITIGERVYKGGQGGSGIVILSGRSAIRYQDFLSGGGSSESNSTPSSGEEGENSSNTNGEGSD